MRIALNENNTNRASQYASYIEDDLALLVIDSLPDVPTTFISQFSEIMGKVKSNPEDAQSKLQSFHNDLLLLIDNL